MKDQFTSRILKGGALLDDTRRLVDVWNPDRSAQENLQRVAVENLLGKRSRVRLQEVLDRVLKPRFVDPGPEVMAALRLLRDISTAFREACYYETAREDSLVARFAEEGLFPRHLDGRNLVSVSETEIWLTRLPGPGGWGDSVRRRVAQGLLATLRDFGILEGAVRKRLAPVHLSVAGFAYSAYREHQAGRSARALVGNPIWRRWLLEESQVRDLFSAAERQGILHYSQAGTAVRIDWHVHSLEEVARAAA